MHFVLKFNCAFHFGSGMSEKKPVVGLSWQPQLPFPSLSKATNDPSHAQFQDKAPSSTIWKPNSELVSGLLVPPNDPRKLNKLLRQQVKDTAGKRWYDLKQVLPFLNATKVEIFCLVVYIIFYTT